MARRSIPGRGSRSRRSITLVSRSALCALGGVSARRLEIWEREELIVPVIGDRDSGGAEPLYDREALRRVRVIRTLEEELDVNLPGIGVILNLLEQFPR